MITFLEEQYQRERKREGGHFSWVIYVMHNLFVTVGYSVCMKLKKVDLIK